MLQQLKMALREWSGRNLTPPQFGQRLRSNLIENLTYVTNPNREFESNLHSNEHHLSRSESKVGRALYQYCSGHGFKSHSSLNFSLGNIFTTA